AASRHHCWADTTSSPAQLTRVAGTVAAASRGATWRHMSSTWMGLWLLGSLGSFTASPASSWRICMDTRFPGLPYTVLSRAMVTGREKARAQNLATASSATLVTGLVGLQGAKERPSSPLSGQANSGSALGA